jgi:hypothetical protein
VSIDVGTPFYLSLGAKNWIKSHSKGDFMQLAFISSISFCKFAVLRYKFVVLHFDPCLLVGIGQRTNLRSREV